MRSNYKRLGEYIRLCNEKNDGMEVDNLLGISNAKYFVKAKTNTIGIDLSTYRIVRKGQFAYNRATTRNGDKISIALQEESDCTVSPSYRIFEVIDENELLPQYLMMWFRRPEFDRYARFKSHGSAHEFFEWESMCDVELPIPSIKKQREIVREYHTITERIHLNEQLNQKLEETAQSIYRQWFVEFEFPDENGKPYKSSGGEMEWCPELEQEIPKGWHVKNLGEVTEYLNRGITPTYTEKDGVIVLNQKCVRNNTIDFTFARMHDSNLKKVTTERYLKQYDILVNSTGTGTLGRVALVKKVEDDMIVDTHITIVRPSSSISSLYLWFSLSTRTTDIENLAEGSTGQTELKRDLLGAMSILIPDKNIQKSFAKLTEQLIDYTDAIDRENPFLSVTKDLLLSKIATIEG